MGNKKLQKVTYLAMMIALDVVLSPLFRIEGMAPMSSVMNVLAGVLLGPMYGTIMALVCGIIRMTLLGIPPLALTGAVFGAFLAGLGYRLYPSVISSMVGEIIGTGIIGSLVSYPVMVWFTGSSNEFYWLMYTPRFIGAACIGSAIAFFIWQKAKTIPAIQKIQSFYQGVSL